MTESNGLTLEAIQKLLASLEGNINENTRSEIALVKSEIKDAKKEIKDSVKIALDEVNLKIEHLEAQNIEKDEVIRKQNNKIVDLEIEIRKKISSFTN